jgi:hypothetical protein
VIVAHDWLVMGAIRYGSSAKKVQVLQPRFKDVVVVVEGDNGEFVPAQTLLGVFDGIKFRRVRRQGDESNVVGDGDVFGDAVAHAIEHESGIAGLDPPMLIDEPVSSITAMVDEIVIGFEGAIGEPVVAQELTIWKIFVDYDRNFSTFRKQCLR